MEEYQTETWDDVKIDKRFTSNLTCAIFPVSPAPFTGTAPVFRTSH